jgi:hypothetical protein
MRATETRFNAGPDTFDWNSASTISTASSPADKSMDAPLSALLPQIDLRRVLLLGLSENDERGSAGSASWSPMEFRAFDSHFNVTDFDDFSASPPIGAQ